MRSIALAVLGLALASQAAAVVLDYRDLGTLDAAGFFPTCGVLTWAFATGGGDGTIHFNGAGAPGLAVDGNDAAAIDAGESVRFWLRNADQQDIASTDVAYEVVAVGPGDGDMFPAEVDVEAFDASLNSLGTQTISGTGLRSVSEAFGNVPISRFEVHSGPDPVRILAVHHQPPEGTPIEISFYQLPTAQLASYELCGARFAGSSDIDVTLSSGIGILGGDFGQGDKTIDQDERLDVTLPEPSSTVRYEMWSGYGNPFVFDVEGFAPGGASLGTEPFSVPFGVVDVGGAFGSELEGFSIIASSPFSGHSVGTLVYAVPEPRAAGLALAATIALAGLTASRLARRRLAWRGAACCAIAALALACGESRQDKFEKAMRAAEVARTGLDSARDEYGKREAAYEEARAAADEAEAELGTARQKLDAATASWDAARVEVARWADDASVSRVLQKALLDEPGLETAALSARVEQGVALLEGTAPSDAARERAVEIARGTPGVADVQSRITVAAGAPAPPAATAPEAVAPEAAAPAESAPAEPNAEHPE